MWFLMVFLIVMLSPWPHAYAEDILLGRVMSVDRKKGKITVTLLDAPEQLTKRGREVPLDQSGGKKEPEEISLTINYDRLPAMVRPGELVRIWGDFDEDSGRLKAKKIALAGSRRHLTDPTGVRRRLGSRHRGSHGGTGGDRGRH